MIAFDIDGVICNSYSIFEKYAKLMWPGKKIGNRTFQVVIPGVDYSKIVSLYREVVEDHSDEMLPEFEAKEGLQSFYEFLNEPLILITSRQNSFSMRKSTERWLDTHIQIPYRLLMIEDKLPVIRHYNLSYMIEDRYKTAHQLATANVCSFLVTRPWNDRRMVMLPNVIRVRSIQDAFDVFMFINEPRESDIC